MAQLYFHYSNTDVTLRDRRGSDFTDYVDACERATQIVRSLIATPGPDDWRGWVLHVSDSDGVEIFALPFASMLGKPN